ncbi:ArsA family ATPase [Mycoplasmatota bacterium]|nr:ArsA family ATPase [Mycoplasmatota bacterium]
MRLIFYTGKDGVGKTSVASIASVHLSSLKLKTLLISTDTNHSLSQVFGFPIYNKPTQVKENLWALEIDNKNKDWDIIHNWLRRLMKWEKLKGIATDEIPIIPGINQILYLLEIKKYLSSNLYDVIIVDCELMGEVLRLLSYPELLEWWIKKLFRNERYLLKMVRPLSKIVSFGFEVPNEQVMHSSEYLMKEFIDLQEIILNQSMTSFRIVLTPDKMGIYDARRAFTYLNMLGFNIDSIIINKILPKELETGFFSKWYKSQEQNIIEIQSSFNPLPIYQIKLMDCEIQGIKQLNQILNEVFNDTDLSHVLYKDDIQKIYKENGKYILAINIPGFDNDAFQISKNDEVLTIEVGSFERLVYLPRILRGRLIEQSFYKNQQLYIQFRNL